MKHHEGSIPRQHSGAALEAIAEFRSANAEAVDKLSKNEWDFNDPAVLRAIEKGEHALGRYHEATQA